MPAKFARTNCWIFRNVFIFLLFFYVFFPFVIQFGRLSKSKLSLTLSVPLWAYRILSHGDFSCVETRVSTVKMISSKNEVLPQRDWGIRDDSVKVSKRKFSWGDHPSFSSTDQSLLFAITEFAHRRIQFKTKSQHLIRMPGRKLQSQIKRIKPIDLHRVSFPMWFDAFVHNEFYGALIIERDWNKSTAKNRDGKKQQNAKKSKVISICFQFVVIVFGGFGCCCFSRDFLKRNSHHAGPLADFWLEMTSSDTSQLK